jgi:hypothetical protein
MHFLVFRIPRVRMVDRVALPAVSLTGPGGRQGEAGGERHAAPHVASATARKPRCCCQQIHCLGLIVVNASVNKMFTERRVL